MMEQEIITKLLSEGSAASLLAVASLIAVIVLWRQMIAKDKTHSDEIKEREKRMEDRMQSYQTEQREVFNQYSALTHGVVEGMALSTAAIENNTKAFQDWGGKFERLSERIERLEAR